MTRRLVILTGGVGGAKLVLGACQVVAPKSITAIVNTGDDFRHLGLHVSPDLDTLLYTLADKSDMERGWGRANETWSFMEAVASLGGEGWFQLGDGDLALHVLRTARMAAGESLSQVADGFARNWGVGVRILPMSDDPVATKLTTAEGELDFQHYFVARRCEPRVSAIRFEGSGEAGPAPNVVEAIIAADAVLVAPSNPFLSIDPILSIGGIRDALRATAAPVVAVSPIVAGRAVKGPTAKLMQELGMDVTQRAIADHYAGIIDAMLVDEADGALGIAHDAADTMMITLDDRARVARAALDLAKRVGRSSKRDALA